MEASQEEINSKVLRAGRRTYFFDVRETKQVITTSPLPRVRSSPMKTEVITTKSTKFIFTRRLSRI